MDAERQGAPIGVLIVDDHLMFAQSLARLLTDEPGIEVLGIESDAEHALSVAKELQPQVVLVDYQMPGTDGTVVAGDIVASMPGTAVLMLTGLADDRVLAPAFAAGCVGVLTKDRAVDEVVDAVHAAAAGRPLVSPEQLARLIPSPAGAFQLGSDLTDRERDVLTLMGRGWSNATIADHLHLSVNTVRNHVQSVLTKLDAHSKLEAVTIALREGLLTPQQGGEPPGP